MEKVEAWKTSDGKVFLDKSTAELHESIVLSEKSHQEKLEANSEKIREYLFNILKPRRFKLSSIGEPYILDWTCDHKDNPVGKCVCADIKGKNWEPSCIYCNEPDERN